MENNKYGGIMKGIMILLITSLFCLLSAASETIQFEENVKPGTTISVDSFNGNVEISSWDKDFVKITATKQASKKKYLKNADIEINNGDFLEIKAIPLIKKSQVGVNFKIKIPKDNVIQLVDTSNGAIKLNNIKGDGRFDTSNSRIEIENSKGDFVLDTSNGAIKCSDISGRISAETSNGSIKFFNVSEIRSADTSNGSITAELNQVHNDLQLSTSNGSITVYLSNDLDIKLYASTSNSSVKMDGVMMQVESQSRNKLRGSLGSGQHKVNLSTSNGGIKIMGMAD